MKPRSIPRGEHPGYMPDLALAVVVHLAVVVPVLVPLLAQWIRHQPGAGEPITALLAQPAPEKPTAPASAVPYKRAAEQKINRLWRGANHGVAANRACLVHVGVRADGTVVLARIARSSGSPAFDESVLRAVRASSPLLPPPDGVLRSGIYEFDLLFDPSD
ncbi:MAG: TonB C-terminal domain-containing protein [Nevskiaceae bacterium]|nr:MAG: TonB C-terminal domain-containing protein [Nevskiaceae bacterium]TBR73050.1 MAG: TonB C-terminal domain-containing protein [Nevskiaceae bacterium]